MKFFSVKINGEFFIGDNLCRKASANSYVDLSDSFMGEIYYDPSIEEKIRLVAEVKAATKKAAKKSAPKKKAASKKKASR